MAHKSMQQLREWIIQRNMDYSEQYLKEDLLRKSYKLEHPTEILLSKCMDGRVNGPLVTRTPKGIVQPLRNLAGRFDLGWPFLGELFGDWVDFTINDRKKCLVMASYHYSEGDNEKRGCAGFHYDKEKSFKFTIAFRNQIESVISNIPLVYPIIVGLETDSDRLIFHGDDYNKTLDVREKGDLKDEDLYKELRSLYKRMSDDMIMDIIPLIRGNFIHINDPLIKNRHVIDSQHRERIICVGRGFDWLHEPNTAIIVGPYSLDLSHPIKTAAHIIEENMKKERISDEGFILLTSGTYKTLGLRERLAVAKTKSLADFAKGVIKENYPDLYEKMSVIKTVLDEDTRLFRIVEEDLQKELSLKD